MIAWYDCMVLHCQDMTAPQLYAHALASVSLQAMCKRFAEYCQGKGIVLSPKGFVLRYDTNIPRQAGLSGSSAIACATLNCLLQHYDVADRCSPLTPHPPSFPRSPTPACPLFMHPLTLLTCTKGLGVSLLQTSWILMRTIAV